MFVPLAFIVDSNASVKFIIEGNCACLIDFAKTNLLDSSIRCFSAYVGLTHLGQSTEDLSLLGHPLPPSLPGVGTLLFDLGALT